MAPLATDSNPGNNIETVRRGLAARLQSAGIEEPGLDARLLIGAALDLDLTGMVMEAARQLTPIGWFHCLFQPRNQVGWHELEPTRVRHSHHTGRQPTRCCGAGDNHLRSVRGYDLLFAQRN